jgi:hypothetical protein
LRAEVRNTPISLRNDFGASVDATACTKKSRFVRAVYLRYDVSREINISFFEGTAPTLPLGKKSGTFLFPKTENRYERQHCYKPNTSAKFEAIQATQPAKSQWCDWASRERIRR